MSISTIELVASLETSRLILRNWKKEDFLPFRQDVIEVKMPPRAAIRAYAPVSPPNSMLDGLGNIASVARRWPDARKLRPVTFMIWIFC